jgi:hypothetical protein
MDASPAELKMASKYLIVSLSKILTKENLMEE